MLIIEDSLQISLVGELMISSIVSLNQSSGDSQRSHLIETLLYQHILCILLIDIIDYTSLFLHVQVNPQISLNCPYLCHNHIYHQVTILVVFL